MARTFANLTMVGKDRTGVVARVTSALFDAGANIEALEERVRRGEFRMLLQASFDDEAVAKRAGKHLARLGEELRMETRFRIHHPQARRRTALFVTKESHCLRGILDAVAAGKLDLDLTCVVSNRKDLQPMVERAKLPFHHVPWTTPERAEARALRILDKVDADLIVLARFMRILSPGFVWRYPNRIVNVHPSLLPSFPGASAYRQAWQHGVRVAGATAHFVTPDLDQGPILAQKAFQLRRDESLESLKKRGQEAEVDALLEALALCVREDLDVHWGRVWFGGTGS